LALHIIIVSWYKVCGSIQVSTAPLEETLPEQHPHAQADAIRTYRRHLLIAVVLGLVGFAGLAVGMYLKSDPLAGLSLVPLIIGLVMTNWGQPDSDASDADPDI
jgi:hypothetical protein